MAVRAISSVIIPYQWIRPSRFMQFGPQDVPKRMKSIVPTHREAQKILEENKFIETPPKEWRERFIVIQDKSKRKIERQQNTQSTYPLRRPMSFEKFKQEHLLTFDEYKKRLKVPDNFGEIKKAYDFYCESNYQGYLIKLEQASHVTIL